MDLPFRSKSPQKLLKLFKYFSLSPSISLSGSLSSQVTSDPLWLVVSQLPETGLSTPNPSPSSSLPSSLLLSPGLPFGLLPFETDRPLLLRMPTSPVTWRRLPCLGVGCPPFSSSTASFFCLPASRELRTCRPRRLSPSRSFLPCWAADEASRREVRLWPPPSTPLACSERLVSG